MKRICDIKGYENIKPFYFVSESGEIISFADHQGGMKKEQRKLTPVLKKSGYYYISLVRNDNTILCERLHRIVAKAFVENENGYTLVHHKDGNKRNNTATNLEWLSPEKHSRVTNSKKMYCYDRSGNLVKEYEYAVLVKEDGFNLSHACNVARGIEKTHRDKYFSFTPLSKENVLQRLSKSYPESGRRK